MQKRFLVILTIMITVFSVYANDDVRLLRHPNINNDQVAFVYGGDLWTVSSEGGEAKQLTTSSGTEVFPKISPDGKWIAFSGEYSGNRQIFVISSQGGTPKQLTFYQDVGQMPIRGGWDNIPVDWTPDGKILFRSNRTPYGKRVSKYFTIDPEKGGTPVALQIPEGGPASLSDDGSKLAYCIKSREYRTWKRYKAGRAQDIFIYDLQNNEIEQITKYKGTDNFPLWIGDDIYFISDRNSITDNDPRTLNFYKYNTNSKNIAKVTEFTEFDCLWASRTGNKITFENGGYIYILDAKTDQYKKITISINSDFPQKYPSYKSVKDNIESYVISPAANRILFSARGELFSVPKKHGNTENITKTNDIREFNVDWSPKGKYISYLSGKSGDYYEIFLKNFETSKEKQLTKNTKSWINGYKWSNNENLILYSDKKTRLNLVNVNTGKTKVVATGNYSTIRSYNFSYDDKWIAYSKRGKNKLTSIWLYSIEEETGFQLTSSERNESNPVFSKDGKYLYFTSERDFDYRNRNFKSKIYIATLQKDVKNPFAARNDEAKLISENKDKKEERNKKSKDKKSKKPKPLIIDKVDFENRIIALPIKSDYYRSIVPVEGGILYLINGDMKKFNIKDRKEETIMKKVRSFIVTYDGKNFIYSSNGSYGIAPLKPNQKSDTGKLDLTGLEMKIDPKIEYNQIYKDAYIIMRDWFYDPDMHGVDWKKMYEKYLPLVPHAIQRADLDYVISEMIGELNCGHTYVNAGDTKKLKKINVGLLGCEIIADGDYYRISNILSGLNWTKHLRSPLTEPGISVKEGEYLISIDGHKITTSENPYQYLENKDGKIVKLEFNDKPGTKGSRILDITTIKSELPHLHLEWVRKNKAIVDRLSGGRIGYIFVPNTSSDGFEAFYKGWAEQSDKEAFIIDDRYNGGGQVPNPMIEKMAATPLSYWAQRNLPIYSTPDGINNGPKVMLINGLSSSGGDCFPAYFKKRNLGILIGKQTWGGLVGYSYSPRFVDGGGMAVPSFAYINTEGDWDVEYFGVNPDIEIFDDPTLIQAGRQPMIEEAVKYLLKELKKNPQKKIVKPDGPVRY